MPQSRGATALSSVAVGTGAQATGVNMTAVGDNSVAIGSGSATAMPNTVSVGSVGNERTLTHVAPGMADTDAITVKQLRDGLAVTGGATLGISMAYTDQEVMAARKYAAQGIAAAAALMNLQPSAAGNKVIGIGMGYFDGNSRLASPLPKRLDWGLYLTAVWRLQMEARQSLAPELRSNTRTGGIGHLSPPDTGTVCQKANWAEGLEWMPDFF